jgi:prepilin-type N-terminal cleavage/methylation domain-containing protein
VIRRAAQPHCRAMTLLEVVIAVALIALLMSALFTFYWQSLEIRNQVGRIADRTEIARQVLGRLEAELHGCVGKENFGFPLQQRLVGDRRSITFLTTALPEEQQYQFYSEFDRLPPARHDLRELKYELWIDPDKKTEESEPLVGGIVRTEKKTLNQTVIDENEPLQIRHDLWSHELGYLEFRYFDGANWNVKWELTEGNPLPHLIQITVGFDSIKQDELDDKDLDTYPIEEYPLGDELPHPDRYSMIVRIPAADQLLSNTLQRVGRDITEQFQLEGGY